MKVLTIIAFLYIIIFIISAIITIYEFKHSYKIDSKEPFLYGETHTDIDEMDTDMDEIDEDN